VPRNDDLRGLIADLTEAQRQLTEELALSGRLSSRFARDHVAILRGIGGRARAGGNGCEDGAGPQPAAAPAGDEVRPR
jgi:hypothetical protein